MIILRILLWPISILYGLVMQCRNLLYDFHILKSFRINATVISIGNITAGGSGKTPFVIYLANHLINLGKNVAIVSRGYGRKSKGFFLISDGRENKRNTALHGDEPVLISLLVPRAVVAVCEDRSQALQQLHNRYNIDVFILDDAFQHRAVYRDIDIVIQKDSTLLKNKWVLPAGMLREFYFNFNRADIIIDRDTPALHPGHYMCTYRSQGLYDINFQKSGSLEIIQDKPCLAFAGIAYPDNFKDNLLAGNITIKEWIPYKDHYSYRALDIQFIIDKCRQNNCKYLLCTMKDLVKISDIEGVKKLLENNGIELFAVGFEVSLSQEESFLKKIEGYLD